MGDPHSSMLAIAAVIGIGIILATELFLWRAFRRKVAGLIFPHETDASVFRFFTLRRMHAIAIAHSFLLAATVAVCFFLLW